MFLILPSFIAVKLAPIVRVRVRRLAPFSERLLYVCISWSYFVCSAPLTPHLSAAVDLPSMCSRARVRFPPVENVPASSRKEFSSLDEDTQTLLLDTLETDLFTQ